MRLSWKSQSITSLSVPRNDSYFPLFVIWHWVEWCLMLVLFQTKKYTIHTWEETIIISIMKWLKSQMMGFIKFVPYLWLHYSLSMNNKCINIHWLFKTKETAVWSWTMRSAQIPILKMWNICENQDGLARSQAPLLYLSITKDKRSWLSSSLFLYSLHMKLLQFCLPSAALWCKNGIEASCYQKILFHCPMEIILGLL